jgi:hypothetical protein
VHFDRRFAIDNRPIPPCRRVSASGLMNRSKYAADLREDAYAVIDDAYPNIQAGFQRSREHDHLDLCIGERC